MTDDRKTVLFRMNGVCNAFMREYGCRDCPQCSPRKTRVHTSGSLIIKSGWGNHREQEHHLLFDCGIGVIDSLMDFGAPFVTHVFLSHNHWDHIAEIDPLVNTQKRSGGPANPPVYCTEGTRREGPEGRFPWLDLNYQTIVPGKPIELDLGISLSVTPVAVYHGPTAYEPVNWVLDWVDPDDGSPRKIVLAWDLLHSVPRYPGEDRDDKYDGEETSESSLLPLHEGTLKGADALFIEGNTLTPQAYTGHTSIEALFRFHLREYAAKRSFIVHYSGHEDLGGPLSDEAVQDWIDENKSEYKLDNANIRMASQGLVLTF